MSREVYLELPVSEPQVRELRVGDIVYVSGVLYTMRDMAHRRAIEALRRGEKLPFELRDRGIWHCGPIVRRVDDRWEALAAGPTSSSRFTELGAELVKRAGLRLIIGKGTMGEPAIEAFRKHGGAYLVATGGCAALYASKIAEVKGVYWLDLGIPEAVWVFKVEELGPLTVGIDSHGSSSYVDLMESVRDNIEKVFSKYGIQKDRSYVWWPKIIAGGARIYEA